MGIPLIGQGPKLIEGDDQKRAKKCLEHVQNVLERYDCVIIPVITIVGTRIIAQMDIQPKPRKMPLRGDN